MTTSPACTAQPGTTSSETNRTHCDKSTHTQAEQGSSGAARRRPGDNAILMPQRASVVDFLNLQLGDQREAVRQRERAERSSSLGWHSFLRIGTGYAVGYHSAIV